MDLTKILSISGKSDLYKHIAKSKNGIIVESLSDGHRMNAFSSMKISTLHDIAIFTEVDDMPLEEVFKLIFKKQEGGKSIDLKSSNEKLKEYFDSILPEYDKDRVYVSVIKRIFKWYNLLIKHNLIEIDEKENEKNNES